MRHLLHLFPKPSHYAGLEDGCCFKDPKNVNLHIALAFPDTYEVGMSYLGHKILYDIVNSIPHWWAERVMAPEREAARVLRTHDAPLCTIESDTPLGELNAVCFSITHELCYPDVLQMLDLAHIPLRHKDRNEDLRNNPIIIAGGGAILGAEPLAPFLDIAAIGDGEELLPEILTLLEKAISKGIKRSEFLLQARHIPGVYIPSFFTHNEKGKISALYDDYRPARRIVANLDEAAYPVTQVIPVGAVHNRLTLEIARGCTRGCRFCHAGIVYRPARERSSENISSLLNKCLEKTGFEEISFLALSAGDYSALKTLYAQTWKRCQQDQITMSLPSLRVGSVDDDIMEKMADIRRTGCTLAPEAGSQRLRDVINKGISEEDIILHCKKLLEHGWRQVKLYFMIGLPTETDADLEAIVSLCAKIRDAGGPGAPRLQVTASLSPFVPKPFTPFQWEEQIDLEEMRRRIKFTLELIKKQKLITMRWHDPEASFLEGILSRGDRRMADVVEKAWRKGAVFCSWQESFSLSPWLEALKECGLDPGEFTGARAMNEPLAWDHLEAGVSNSFLLLERKKAIENKITPDCRYHACQNCGACDRNSLPSRLAKKNTDKQYKNRLVFASRDQQSHRVSTDAEGKLLLRDTHRSKPKLNPELAKKAAHYRIWHSKEKEFAFLSQLELQATLDRYLRRATMPLAYSQGFHPLPLISFGRALPVSVESRLEWFVVTLHKILAPDFIHEKLNSFMPENFKIFLVEEVDKKCKSLQAVEEKFYIALNDRNSLNQYLRNFEKFAALHEFVYQKNVKSGTHEINLRPFLKDWTFNGYGFIFTCNWLSGYISPLILIKSILSLDIQADALLNQIKIIKISQSFPDGKIYELPS